MQIHCIRHTAHNMRGEGHTVHTVHMANITGKHGREGKIEKSQLLSINQSFTIYWQKSIHSSAKGNRTGHSIYFSFNSSIHLSVQISIHFSLHLPPESENSATQTSQDKRSLLKWEYCWRSGVRLLLQYVQKLLVVKSGGHLESLFHSITGIASQTSLVQLAQQSHYTSVVHSRVRVRDGWRAERVGLGGTVQGET